MRVRGEMRKPQGARTTQPAMWPVGKSVAMV